MKPGNYPLDLYRGDSYHWQFVLWADAAKTMPVDLSQVTPKAEIRDTAGRAQVTPITCSVSAPNVINADLSATACAGLTDRSRWDLQLSYANGEVATVLAGPVTVTADVTDSGAPAVVQGAHR